MACGGLGGDGFVLAVMRDLDNQSSAWGWGGNAFGQLGQNDRLYAACANPRLVRYRTQDVHTQAADITMVACAHRHCCVVLASGHAFYWGDINSVDTNRSKPDADRAFQYVIPAESSGHSSGGGSRGHMHGDARALRVRAREQPLPAHVVMAACGDSHQLLLTASGRVYSFGNLESGVLGYGVPLQKNMPLRVAAGGLDIVVVVMVAAGGGHSVALDDSGSIWTWGNPAHGALGHGPETIPVTSANPRPYLNTSRYTHAFTSPRRLDGAVPGRVVMISARGACCAAVDADGSVWMWGHGSCGQLGLGDTADRNTPTQLDPAVFAARARAGAGGAGAGAGGAGSAARSVACGGLHTLVVTQDGMLWAFGSGQHGQLGCGGSVCAGGALLPLRVEFFDQHAAVVSAAANGSQSVAVTADGRIYTWGGDERLTRPRPVDALAHMHAGPHQGLCPALALGLAMSTHLRLGRASGTGRCRCLCNALPEDLLRRLCAMSGGLAGPAGRSEGIKRLVGAT